MTFSAALLVYCVMYEAHFRLQQRGFTPDGCLELFFCWQLLLRWCRASLFIRATGFNAFEHVKTLAAAEVRWRRQAFHPSVTDVSNTPIIV